MGDDLMGEYVHRKVDNLFMEVVREYNLKNGDVTPLQSIRIDDFEKTLKEFIEQNIPRGVANER